MRERGFSLIPAPQEVSLGGGEEVKIHEEGSGRVVIPDGAVLRGVYEVRVPDGETVTVGG